MSPFRYDKTVPVLLRLSTEPSEHYKTNFPIILYLCNQVIKKIKRSITKNEIKIPLQSSLKSLFKNSLTVDLSVVLNPSSRLSFFLFMLHPATCYLFRPYLFPLLTRKLFYIFSRRKAFGHCSA